MSEPASPNPLPPRGQPVFDNGAGPFTVGWYRALRQALQSGAAGITQLVGDVLAGPGGGVQTAELSTTGVTPGPYTSANITVDAKGRILEAADGGTAAATNIGFGFEVQGILADNEQIGFASWPVDVTFDALNPDSYLNAWPIAPATADAVFNLTDVAFTSVGTITVAAGTTTGVLAFVTDPAPYTHPAFTPLLVFSPSPADATLANVNALVVGAGA